MFSKKSILQSVGKKKASQENAPTITIDGVLKLSSTFKQCKAEVDAYIKSGETTPQFVSSCATEFKGATMEYGTIALYHGIAEPYHGVSQVLPREKCIGGEFIKRIDRGVLHTVLFATPETKKRILDAKKLVSVYFVNLMCVPVEKETSDIYSGSKVKEDHYMNISAFGVNLQELEAVLGDAISVMKEWTGSEAGISTKTPKINPAWPAELVPLLEEIKARGTIEEVGLWMQSKEVSEAAFRLSVGKLSKNDKLYPILTGIQSYQLAKKENLTVAELFKLAHSK